MHTDWLSLIATVGGVAGLLIVTVGPIVALVLLARSGRLDLLEKADDKLDATTASLVVMQEKQLGLLKEEVAKLTTLVAELQGKLNAMQEQYTALLAAKEAELSRLQGSVAELRDERQRLYARNAAHELTIEALQRERDALRRARRRVTDPPPGEDGNPEEDRL